LGVNYTDSKTEGHFWLNDNRTKKEISHRVNEASVENFRLKEGYLNNCDI